MKFDVIIGNPPYQLETGGDDRPPSSARAIYHLFVDKAIELNPKYITMIIPSRWMGGNAGGVPIDWIDKMVNDTRIKEIHDFIDSKDCFTNVKIRGGVNYFLWDKYYSEKCSFYQHSEGKEIKFNKDYLNTKNSGVIVRDVNALSIVDKVVEVEGDYLEKEEQNFSSMVSPTGYFISGAISSKLGGSWKGFSMKEDEEHTVKYYTSKFLNGTDVGWGKRSDILRNVDTKDLHKVLLSASGENEKFGKVITEPRYSEPNSIASGTYLIIGYDNKKHNFTKEECYNIISYIRTKFFRFMVDVKKASQHCARGVYQFVPLQDWSKPWTDEELYKKYKLTQEEIDYIENNIKPMS